MEDDISPANAAKWEALNDTFVEPPEFVSIQKAVVEQFETVAVRKDDSQPWGVANRAKVNGIVVTGLHRVGKTDLVEEVLGTLDAVTTVCGQTIAPKVVRAECPPTFSSAALGRHLMRLLKYPSERQFSADWAWDRVDMRLPKEQPTVIFIDEYQRSFHPVNVGRKRLEDVRLEVQSVFRHLLDLPAWPTPLVLVGVREVIELLEDPKYKFLRDRLEIFSVANMRTDEPERTRLRSALDSFCQTAKLSMDLPDNDFFNRLIHASGHARGLAIDLCKSAVIDVWTAGGQILTMSAFVDRYRRKTGACDEANPFYSKSWHNLDSDLLLRVSEQDQKSKHRPDRKNG